MNTKHFAKAAMLLLSIFSFTFSFAGGGSIMGQVIDPDTKQPVANATVVLDCQGNQHEYVTDAQGRYYASNIPAGTYVLYATYMENNAKVENVKLSSDETQEINVSIVSTIKVPDVVVNGGVSKNPLMDPFGIETKVVTSIDLKHTPVISVTQLPEMQARVVSFDGNIYVSGARADGVTYYIDGCKITGNPNVPLCGVDFIRTYFNFIPAKYGDTVGGIFEIETKSFFTE